MELTNKSMLNPSPWEKKGYHCYSYDREIIKQNTIEKPEWIHFGAGNIFRAFPANLAQRLLHQGDMKTGIIVAEGFDQEILDKAYEPFDDLSILATLKKDGEIDKTIIGSVIEHLHLDISHHDWRRLISIFKSPSLQIATFTITEKGYQLQNTQNEYYPIILDDFKYGPKNAKSYLGMIASLLYERYLENKLPLTLVSLDNCSHNGELLEAAIHCFAKEWTLTNLVEEGFYEYICVDTKVSFPCTMIDKITPRPSDQVIKLLQEDGIAHMQPIKTSKGTFVAPFVNAEETEYLVIEDKFSNHRPPLEKVGVLFCDKRVVEQVERMKVCTCLNPLHTTMAIFGCLFHHQSIYDCMQDSYLRELVKRIGYQEGLPVVTNPKIINPKEFIDEVLNVRFVNPFMPDTPQRIATDTSLKLGIRFGETIKAYQSIDNFDMASLSCIPFVFAGWCRYLLGIDDDGNQMELSDDPLLEWTSNCLRNVHIGEACDVHEILKPILSNQQIFHVDLKAIGMTEKIEQYFSSMIKGNGAVKESLKHLLDTSK